MSNSVGSQNDRKSRLLDAMPAIAWSASAQTFRFTYVNPAAEAILGYPAERWIDEPHFWTEHIHPDDKYVAMLCHNETLACRNHELIYRMVAADGRVVWLRDYVNVHTVDGVAEELFGVMVDITREREAEDASRENRENFRRMVELSPDCLGVCVDGTYVYVNQAFVQLLGAKSETEIVGHDLMSFIDPASHHSAHQRLARLRAGESVPYLRQKYRRMDGSPLHVEVAALPLRYGNRDAIQVIARDVTDRVRAEEELREAEHLRAAAEAKFRWIVEQSMVAVYMISGRRLTYINDVGAKMFGYSADELMSVDIATLLHQDDRHAVNFFGSGSGAARVRRGDGTLLHAVFYQNEVTVDGEQIIIGTSADITESVQARQALEASEQRYRELVEDVTDILFTVDLEGRFVSFSHSFERSTGYRVEEWIGRPFADLFLPADAGGYALDGDRRIIREYNVPARSGAVVTVEVSSQPRYIEGELAGTIGVARDVTEQRTIARKLEEAKRMSSLGQVAASLAHEFNNVLMGIQPFVETLARTVPDTLAVRDSIGHITRAIGRGKRASQEILRFANPKEPLLSAIDIRTWLPTLLGQMVAALPSSIALSSELSPGVHFIRGDSEHLEQVITNLVFNARDAISGGGTIHVDVAPAGAASELVRISVRDDGPGIAPATLPHIFEPLFTTKRNGTGLGLAIARRLMEGQNGTLTAENHPEGGAAFHLEVRAAEAPAPSEQPFSCATPGVRHILIVEDDFSVGAGLEAVLQLEGFETTWVRAASEACHAARRTQPQVAIIDVNLPDGNGVDLIPLLRAEHDELPIVLSTGHVELNVACGRNRITSLMKPYEMGDLLAAIGHVTAA
jgi:two-component system cell cycle sensor histidine kinase/response regulator CckA